MKIVSQLSFKNFSIKALTSANKIISFCLSNQQYSSSSQTVVFSCSKESLKMFALRLSACIVVIAFIMAAVMFTSSEAAYRKPPFNGSIFGKRNSVEYDNAKAITAMCEIAMEACQSWFPQNESK